MALKMCIRRFARRGCVFRRRWLPCRALCRVRRQPPGSRPWRPPRFRRRFRPSGRARSARAPHRRPPRSATRTPTSNSRRSPAWKRSIWTTTAFSRRWSRESARSRPCRRTFRRSVSCRARGCPFENPLLAVFKKKGNEWDLLLAAHLPMRCNQTDDPAKCDELLTFRSVPFRFDDRPQVALQIVHAGEPRLTETMTYRLDRGRLDATFSSALPRSGVEVDIGPEGITRPHRGRHLHQQGAAAAVPKLHPVDQLHLRGAQVPNPLREHRAGMERP